MKNFIKTYCVCVCGQVLGGSVLLEFSTVCVGGGKFLRGNCLNVLGSTQTVQAWGMWGYLERALMSKEMSCWRIVCNKLRQDNRGSLERFRRQRFSFCKSTKDKQNHLCNRFMPKLLWGKAHCHQYFVVQDKLMWDASLILFLQPRCPETRLLYVLSSSFYSHSSVCLPPCWLC